MTATFIVTFRVRTLAARCWVRAMQVAQFVIGRERAERWAVNGARRLIRINLLDTRAA